VFERNCANCLHYRAGAGNIGDCKRYPQTIQKDANDCCSEWRIDRLPEELLCVPVDSPGWFSGPTSAFLKRNGIRCIADILDIPRYELRTTGGHLAREIIDEIAAQLAREGIIW
jgi:hypothetical protein